MRRGLTGKKCFGDRPTGVAYGHPNVTSKIQGVCRGDKETSRICTRLVGWEWVLPRYSVVTALGRAR